MKKRYKFWLGILISGLFFFLFIKGIDLGSVWKATRESNYFYVFLAIVINVITFLIRAKRWEYLLDPIKRVKFHSLFSAVCIGFMGNSLLPARAGEFIRAYVIGKREEISKTGSFATIVTERLFDGLTLLIMLIIVVSIFPFPKESYGSYITLGFLRWAIGITSFFYGIVISTLILLSWKPIMCRPSSRGSARSTAVEPAVHQPQRAVGPVGDLRIVRDDDEGHAVRVQFVQQRHDLLARLGVQVARGLVRQNDQRVAGQGACDAHALAFASTQLRRHVR